jgi:hypothetical protein
MANVASLRALVAGSGSLTMVSVGAGKPAKALFGVAQEFRHGETLFLNIGGGVNRYTIDHGTGVDWYMNEPQFTLGAAGTWRRTNPGNSRARATDANAQWVPRAQHFVYWSPMDASGNPDCYTYIDTIYPVRGQHPYTGDLWTGRAWLARDDSSNQTGVPAPDLGNRLAALDTLPSVIAR